METLKKFLLPDSRPAVAADGFIAHGAIVLGAVELREQSSGWYGAVLRGVLSDDCACVLGDRVTVGHRAVVHACTVGDEVLVGMGAIILDGAQIGARSIIAAGALVTKNMVVPEGSLVVGSPARVMRALTVEEQQANAKLALKYVEVARRYLSMGLGGEALQVTPIAAAED
ncbi:MAG: hypothetical protein B7Z47_05850 [Chthoniobacter sp. 12-60-6]|nr:MAG: hypothetical protein B7Z47_05850 [Chthoniobacter sp. 12-60-6]